MTDGELLARAAQVAQLPGELPPPDQEYGWNPLLYNCDAFDLLVQLGLRVQFLEVGVDPAEPARRTCRVEWTHAGVQHAASCTVPAGPAGMATVRRAIVQAAAAMGGEAP